MNLPGTNTGHGHVWERPDGLKARCGGPGLCKECSADAARMLAPFKSADYLDDPESVAAYINEYVSTKPTMEELGQLLARLVAEKGWSP